LATVRLRIKRLMRWSWPRVRYTGAGRLKR